MMGALSRVTPVDTIDPRLWLKVLEKISPSPAF
jgi:hypothetical protein